MAMTSTLDLQFDRYKPKRTEENKDSFSIDNYLKTGQRHDLLTLSGNSADMRFLGLSEGIGLLNPEMYLEVLHLQIDGEDRYLYLSPLEQFIQLFGAIFEDQEIFRKIISRGEQKGYSRGYSVELKITVNIRDAQVQIDATTNDMDIQVMGFRLKTTAQFPFF